MRAAFGGDRRVVIARELTKRHESILRATLAEAVSRLESPRGEYVLIVAGRARERAVPAAAERTLEVLLEALPVRQAVDLAARASGVPRKRMYRLALAWRGRARFRGACLGGACLGGARPRRLRRGAGRRKLAGRESAGQSLRRAWRRGGKSGLHRAGCQVTPGGREPTESATENIPPGLV